MQKHTDGHLAGAPGHRLGACPGVSMASSPPRNTWRTFMREFFTRFIGVFSLVAGCLVAVRLAIKHLRLVLGNSMGGMQTWIWGVKYPELMDALVPMACQPTEMSGRNWMLRRMLADAIRNDPEWNGGNYGAQPRGMQRILVQFGIATSGGSQAYYKQAPTREKADAGVTQRLAQPFRGDANDVLYQWESSDDYNPSPGLARIRAALVAINSADDERNPPELGILEREIKRVKGGRYVLIPASADTRGHGTTGNAALSRQHLADLLQSAPRMAK